MPMMKANIDYGEGETAELWGDFTAETVEDFFMEKANQCFGIRKSIMGFTLESIEQADLPEPWNRMSGAATVLKHHTDVIVWNDVGEKIKTEWD